MAKAPKPAVFILGLPEVDRALKEFPDKVRKSIARTAFRTIAKKIKEDAVAAAPRKTGALAASLKVFAVARKRGRGARAARGIVGASIRTKEGFFKGDEFYGGFIELGTKERTQKKTGKKVGQILASVWSFIRPALYRNEAYAKAHFADAVRQAIAAARVRAAKKAALPP